MQDRAVLLESLVKFSRPLKEVLAQLAPYGSDAVKGEALIVLRSEDIVAVLQRFLRAELTAEDVHAWADALELRDDVEFGEADSGDVFDVVFDLATPEVQGRITRESAEILIKKLEG